MSTVSDVIDTGFTREKLELWKRLFCKGATDDEFQLFVNIARKLGLDPETRQIHCVKRYNSALKQEVMEVQIGLGGYRTIANRSGKFEWRGNKEWCGKDGVWKDVWLDDDPPVAARCPVKHADFEKPFVEPVRYKALVQTTREGGPNLFWRKMDAEQLGKCAEVAALRAAFADETSGVLSPEEAAAISGEGAADGSGAAPSTATPKASSVSDKLAQRDKAKRDAVAAPAAPTHTSKTYEAAPSVAFSELGSDGLTAYLDYCTDVAKSGEIAIRATAQSHVEAVQVEIERRIEAEQSQAAKALPTGDERMNELQRAISGSDQEQAAARRERQPGEDG